MGESERKGGVSTAHSGPNVGGGRGGMTAAERG